MKISKTHQRFSERLKNLKVLTNPEDFLGPNWKDVINFWLHFDTLTKSEKEKINDRYFTLDADESDSKFDAILDAADEVVRWRYDAMRAAYDVSDWYIFEFATLELIAYHKLLEKGITLEYLPLFFNKQTEAPNFLSLIKQFLNL
jgi:hypothetical protein